MPVIQKEIKAGANTANGYVINLPNANLVIAVAAKGYVICGYLNMETAEKLGDCAAVVTGVKTVEELLAKNVVKTSSTAERIGIHPGMTGMAALEKMF